MITIPKSYINGLNIIPKKTPVAIVMRHAERLEIRRGDTGFNIPLTEDGRKSAFKLGAEHLEGKISNIYSSVVGRCIDTGENILNGAKSNLKVIKCNTLFGEDIFVSNFAEMSNFYMKNGMITLLDLAYDRKEVIGLNNVDKSVHQFINFVLEKIENNDGLSLFITHDMFISLIVGEIFRHRTTDENWPNFMEPIFIWKEGDDIKLFFRDYLKTISTACVRV
jgi:broad specificity phosphatase PhoE